MCVDNQRRARRHARTYMGRVNRSLDAVRDKVHRHRLFQVIAVDLPRSRDVVPAAFNEFGRYANEMVEEEANQKAADGVHDLT